MKIKRQKSKEINDNYNKQLRDIQKDVKYEVKNIEPGEGVDIGIFRSSPRSDVETKNRIQRLRNQK